MGATVLDAVRVTSRKTASGAVAYLWQEETHDLRGDPKDRNWCVMAFGNKADIVRRIYLMAESVASGMLKVGGQSVTAFVDAMLKKLDSPGHMRCATALLENTGDVESFSAAITPSNRDVICQYLRENDRSAIAEKITAHEVGRSEKIEFSVDNDFDVLRGIINDVEHVSIDYSNRPTRIMGIAAWRAFGYVATFDEGGVGPTSELQAVEQLAKLDLGVYATDINVGYGNGADPENAFVATLSGQPIYFGGIQYDHYRLTQALVGAALDVHLKTGQQVLRPLLKTLKKGLESPKPMPADTVVRFDCTGSYGWVKEKIGEVRAMLGQDNLCPDAQLTATVGELAKISSLNCDALRHVIDSAKAEFLLPSKQPALL